MKRDPGIADKLIRFAGGFVCGGFISFYIAIHLIDGGTKSFWAAVLAGAVASGLLAMRYGDAFWEKFWTWFTWL